MTVFLLVMHPICDLKTNALQLFTNNVRAYYYGEYKRCQ